jgi:hypothetical protein
LEFGQQTVLTALFELPRMASFGNLIQIASHIATNDRYSTFLDGDGRLQLRRQHFFVPLQGKA